MMPLRNQTRIHHVGLLGAEMPVPVNRTQAAIVKTKSLGLFFRRNVVQGSGKDE
jgi:hypothetical protein